MSPRRLALVGLLTCTGLAMTGCGGSGPDRAASSTAGTTSSARTTPSSGPMTSTETSSTGTPTDSDSSTSTPPSSSSGPTASTSSCVSGLVDDLGPAQRAGQLVMIALDPHGSQAQVQALIAQQHVGNVVFLGGWQGSANVRAASSALQGETTTAATGDIGLLVAADQEGGEVQQLQGPGFTRMPSAAQQAADPATVQRNAATMGRELERAGVNVDLAPVADTVPTSIGNANAPIGRFDRQYGHSPQAVSRAVTKVVRGLHQAGVAATLKHFPGIGRITGNTDLSATGISDPQMTRHDPYLKPFAKGIDAGAGLVMVGSARYPSIDATHQAVFSRTIIHGMLRGDLGFRGVVISDDLNAVAVRHVPVGQRAVKFIGAGGDIALTGATSQTPQIIDTIASKAKTDQAFASKVKQSVTRVLTLKTSMGLTPCSKQTD